MELLEEHKHELERMARADRFLYDMSRYVRSKTRKWVVGEFVMTLDLPAGSITTSSGSTRSTSRRSLLSGCRRSNPRSEVRRRRGETGLTLTLTLTLCASSSGTGVQGGGPEPDAASAARGGSGLWELHEQRTARKCQRLQSVQSQQDLRHQVQHRQVASLPVSQEVVTADVFQRNVFQQLTSTTTLHTCVELCQPRGALMLQR